MTLTLDIAEDFETVTDNLHSVTVDGINVNSALRRAVTTKEAAASGGKALASDTVFHLSALEQEARPAIGGAIVDSDGTWTILSVQWQTFVKRWRCICRQLFIDASDPANKVTIQQATYAKGDTGAQEPAWQTIAQNVVAKVQWQSSRVSTEHTDRTTESVVKVFFTESRSLGVATRIITSDSKTLKVLSWDGFSEIDQFFTATCEVSQWPEA